jgi:hypothetical protein
MTLHHALHSFFLTRFFQGLLLFNHIFLRLSMLDIREWLLAGFCKVRSPGLMLMPFYTIRNMPEHPRTRRGGGEEEIERNATGGPMPPWRRPQNRILIYARIF